MVKVGDRFGQLREWSGVGDATEGVDLAALRTMAGHASVTTTMNVYVHATRRHHELVRRIVGDFLGIGAVTSTRGMLG